MVGEKSCHCNWTSCKPFFSCCICKTFSYLSMKMLSMPVVFVCMNYNGSYFNMPRVFTVHSILSIFSWELVNWNDFLLFSFSLLLSSSPILIFHIFYFLTVSTVIMEQILILLWLSHRISVSHYFDIHMEWFVWNSTIVKFNYNLQI